MDKDPAHSPIPGLVQESMLPVVNNSSIENCLSEAAVMMSKIGLASFNPDVSEHL